MDASVVDDVGLDDAVAGGLQDAAQRVSEQVVADVAEVEGLVGVGRGVLYHHQGSVRGWREDAEVRVGGDAEELPGPVGGVDGEVEEALDDVVGADAVDVFYEPLADGLGGVFGLCLGGTQEGEDDHGVVAIEALAGGAGHGALYVCVRAVEGLHGPGDALCYLIFYLHFRVKDPIP